VTIHRSAREGEDADRLYPLHVTELSNA
jgi:hypothetical protein